jgi:hypothetical protein
LVALLLAASDLLTHVALLPIGFTWRRSQLGHNVAM